MSPPTRIAAETFWEYVAFALNSIVFLLIGFEVHIRDLVASWPAILAAYAAVTVGRAVVIYGGSGLLHLFRQPIPSAWTAVLTWGGLRGALSMVLALSLPQSFPNRELLVTMTFGVVILSILAQGLTMAPVLRWLGIVERQEVRSAYDLARGKLQSANAALQEVDVMERTRLAPGDILQDVRLEYEARVTRVEEHVAELRLEREALHAEEAHRARRHLLLVEKDRAIELFRRGAIGREAYDRLLADIDARLLRLEAGDSAPGDGEDVRGDGQADT